MKKKTHQTMIRTIDFFGRNIKLLPENKKYFSTLISKEEIEILGKITQIISDI